VVYERHDAIAVVRLNNPPVNSLGHELRKSIVDAIQRANCDSAVRAVILTGTARAFSAGADLRELGTEKAYAPPDLADVIRVLESSTRPVIAAIGGVCMGGGLELALGAHYRIATRDAQIAFPEVKLGLLPGAGGTQRLPRVLGLERALDLIVSGTTLTAEKLNDTPLFDALASGDLLAAALGFARQIVAHERALPRVRDVALKKSDSAALLHLAGNHLKAISSALPAPRACVEAIAAAASRPFEEGLKFERELFFKLLASPESAGLRHVFLAERAAGRLADVPEDTPTRRIESVGVVGAGTMGGGIAMALANAGIKVVLLEASQEALDRGTTTIRRHYESSSKKGKLTAEQVESRLGLIVPTLSYDLLRTADLVIEAVFENLEVKQAVFRKLDEVCKRGAILASNTSFLDINTLASLTGRPEDVLGLHFFSPANIMRLLEIVRGARTAPDVLATAVRLARKINKLPVVAGVCDGFIGNRMVEMYFAAADDLLMLGASPQEIDFALEGFGFAMGPYRMIDLAGNDIRYAARKRRAREHPQDNYDCVADELCEAGRLGQKTGVGWYRYEPGSRQALPDPLVDAMIARYRARRGMTPRPVTAEQIVERCLLALINEAAHILEEGIAQRPSDIDLVYINGYGFPAHRGGPLFYADQLGLPNIVRALERIASEPAARTRAWTPAPLLQRLAAESKTFN
jgi:3-hydroxyacyl-CoA dehydrogenase